MDLKNKNKGFTLIEMLVYIALLGILMTGALLGAWQILQGSAQISSRTTPQDEESFVLGKINWALEGVKTISTPNSGTPYGSTLSLTKYDTTTVDICLKSQTIWMRENKTGGTCGDGSYASTTTNNVTVSALNFHYIAGPPAGLEAAVTIKSSVSSASNFVGSTTRYVR
jgi:prepilin-type N-terminal cleavage/methylation domain-containing protein